MRKIVFSIFLLFISQLLTAQTTISFWDFNSVTNDGTTSTGTTNPATGTGTLSLIGGITSPGFNAGESSDPNGTDNSAWQTTTYPALGTANKTAGIQIDASTASYSGIKLEFWQRLSGTANNTWTVQYTLDKTAGTPVWIDFQEFTFVPSTTTGNVWYFRSVDFTSVSGLNNNANVAFRVVASFDPITNNYRAATSSSSYATAGTSRFDLIKITATPPAVPHTIAFVKTDTTVTEANTTVNLKVKVTSAGNSVGTVDLGASSYSTATSDYTLPTTLTIPANATLNQEFNFVVTLSDDAVVEADEYVICKLINATNVTISSPLYHTLYIKDNDYVVPTANNQLSLNLLASFSNGTAFNNAIPPVQINSAEISAYDATSKRIFIANSIGAKLDIVNFANPTAPSLITSIDISPYGSLNSVAVKNGIVALAIENGVNKQANGMVVFLDTDGVLIDSVTAGAMPDMIAFNHAGTKVYTANEGEPNDAYTTDPEGSITVVDITTLLTTGVTTAANVTNISFSAYNGQEATLRSQGIRIYGTGASAAQDFEPEYITISDDDSTAWVTLQENNAIAEVNLITNTITQLIPLGYKNHSLVGNGLDASDQTFGVNIANFPVKGMYLPDAIASYNVGGTTYFITANEGDARAYTGMNEETRVGSMNLDATVFPNAAELKDNRVLGRLRTTNKLGDIDNDNDFDEIYAFGARSFSIWNTNTATMTYDSGNELEQITNVDASYAAFFNQNSGGVRKDRSDDKGPEAEGVAIGKIGNKNYAFVAMERTGGTIIYDVTNPAAPTYVTYANNRPTDISPEGTVFIPATQSPNGKNLLILSNEISSTLSVYEVTPCAAPASIATIATASGDTSICPSGSLKLLSVNADDNNTYQWYKNDSLIVGATDSTYFANQAGVYKLVAYNISGCTATSASMTLIIDDSTNPTITAPNDITVVANNGCGAIVSLGTPIAADNCMVASVTNNAPATFPIGTTNVVWTVTDGLGNTAVDSQMVTVNDQVSPAIYFTQDRLVAGVQGINSSATPYLKPMANGVKFTSLLTVGDSIGNYKMTGIPDGLGAFDNGDNTFTVLINHELQPNVGAMRAHGSIGSFVSKWIINKGDLSVTSGSDLIQQLYVWNTTNSAYELATGAGAAIGRLCSGDLPAISAFYNPNTKLGTTERIFMSGEEVGAEGRTFAHVATGTNAGKSYQLPRLGRASWENAVASPLASDLTIVAETDDATPGQVYFYVGTKTNTGSEIEKAGLTNGNLYAVTVPSVTLEDRNTPINGTFSLTNLGDVSNTTGTSLNTMGGTNFLRPEDGAWDPNSPADFYFVTTDRFDQVKIGTGSQVGRSRLYRLRFTDITNPTLGGTIAAVLDGTEVGNMMDNMNIDKQGHIFIQEDPGNQAYSAKILQYDIATDQLTVIAKHDSTRFGDIGIAAAAPFSQDEESSGIVDVSDILGEGMHLLVQQAHYSLPSPLIEGGQLLAVFIPSSIGVASTAADTITLCATSVPTINLGTPATGDNCTVSTIVNNAPTTFPLGTITPVIWTVTDINGNINTATQYVKVNTGSTVSLTQYGGITSGTGITTLTQACMGNSITLVANTSGPMITNYQWQRNGVDLAGQTNDSLTISSSWGVYRVRTTNINTCITNTDTFAITIRPKPVAKAGADRNVCIGNSTTLGAAPLSNYTYTWTPSTSLSNANIANPVLSNVSDSGQYVVQVSQAIANSTLVCTSFDTVFVNVLALPTAPTIAVSAPANLVGLDSVSRCEGSGAITLTPSGTLGNSHLQWLRNGTPLSLTTNLSAKVTVSNTSGAAVTYTARVRNAAGCYSPASNAIVATIKQAAIPTITPAGTNNTILLCLGANSSASQLLTASVASGTPTYAWYQSGNVTSVGSGSTYNATITNSATSKSFRVTATYPNACTRTSAWKTVRKNTTCREDMTTVEEVALAEEMTAYPNPTSDKLKVSINNSAAFSGKLTLSNALGQIIMSQNIDITEGNAMETLDMSSLSQGVYHLTFDTETTHQVVKVIKE